VTSSYSYDALYELTQVVQAPTTTESYSYDAVGNRLSSLSVPSYTYNASNQLLSSGVVTWGYDANGSVSSRTDSGGTITGTWDFENRGVRETLPNAATINFKYDPFGRRIQKSSSSGTTNYVYDGDNIIEELSSTGTSVARYAQSLGIDEPLAMYRSGVGYAYHADGLGSIGGLTDANGNIAATYTYDSFGNPTASTGHGHKPLPLHGAGVRRGDLPPKSAHMLMRNLR
jgi:YD repeat-containing protein